MGDFWMYAEFVLRLALAVIFGGLIGFERELSNHPAGLRTHILVCVTSALIMITSERMFARYSDIVNIDPMRLGAQIISGIGFLGAGAIIKEGVTIKGLTTAACLWSVACVGIALGVGFYFGAAATTAVLFSVLIFLRKLERFIRRHRVYCAMNIEIRNTERARILKSVEDVIYLYHSKPRKTVDMVVKDAAYVKYDFFLSESIPKSAIANEISSIDGVVSVVYDSEIGL